MEPTTVWWPMSIVLTDVHCHYSEFRYFENVCSSPIYRVPTLKHPDFEDVLQIDKWFLSYVKGLLRTTGVQIPI
jgi:hypothetical protein